MINSTQLRMLRTADPGAVLPGVDAQVGNPLPPDTLISAPTLNQSGVIYDLAHNRVSVTKAGTVLNGINFGGLDVEIQANNVTIENSSFSSPLGYYSVQVDKGYSGTVVTHNTFDSQLVPSNAGWIGSAGYITVTDNKFIDSPGDGVYLGSGVVSGNEFDGVGNSDGSHADAIWVTNSQGPVTISNNLINWVNDGTSGYANDAVRITTELGSVSNVTVTGNYLLGGGYTVDAGNEGTGTFSNININNNYIGFGLYGAFYPGAQSGVTTSANIVFDFTNPSYSTQAWAAYQAAGIPTTRLVTSTGADIGNTTASPATLYGAGYAVHLGGGAGENILVGGFGRQYIMGGAGANIVTELAVPDSTVNHPDIVGNFSSAKDVIDLSHIDANLTAAGVQNFTFIGTAAFSGGGAQVRYEQDAAHTMTYVEADLAGDSTPDVYIQLVGLQTLTAANFALTAAESSAAVANGVSGSALVLPTASAPTISGTASGRATTSEAPVHPFAGVTLADANAGATDTLTITVAGAGGTLSGTGLTGGTGGVYTLSGAAAAITSALDALSFAPKAGAPNTTSTSTFTLSDLSSANAVRAVDSATSVVDSDPAAAPTISGTASGQSTTSEAPVHPFAGVTIADPNAGATDTLTITVAGAGGMLSGTGLTGGSGGVYSLSGAAAAITSALDALSFAPKAGAPNTASTSTFTLSDSSSAFATPAVDSLTSVVDSDPAITNPNSAQAWAAYQAAGIPTARLVTSTGADISNATTSPTTLYAAGYTVHLGGGVGENNFVGGLGRQYIMGGAGANIITELAVPDSTVNSPDIVGNFNSAKDVIDLSHVDANLTAAGLQNFTFIGTAAFSGGGAQVRYQQDAAHNMTYVEADLAGDSTPDVYIQLTGLQTLTAANFALTAAQSSADLTNGAALSVSTIRSASSPTEYSYTNIVGEPYASFQSIYANSSTLLANNLNFSSTTNEFDLLGNGLAISRGSGAESVKVGTSAFSLGYRANETIDASASGAQTFAFGANFGNETIKGFTASGTSADTIQMALSSFSYLNSGMTQAQDLAAVLANATSSASGTTIHDSGGDSLALTGFTPSMISAAASQFHFA